MAPSTLLLADDNTTIQRVIELTFAEQGIKVVSVSDGQQAIDYLAAQRPDIALVGVSLQKRDGYEVAAFIQQEPSLRGVPLLLLAGAFDTLDEARVRESGAAGVLIKPFEPRQVINRVKELLGISARQAEKTDARRAAIPESGRLVTSTGGPTPRVGDRSPAAVDAPPGRPEPGWDQLRHDTGLAPDTPPVEGPATSGDDYFEQLDAAFDSLDAQLAGRGAPSGRATNPPPPRYPAALDPGGRRPDVPAPAAGESAPPERMAALPSSAQPMSAPAVAEPSGAAPGANPVFEVDDEWFPPGEAHETSEPSASSASSASARTDSPASYGETSPKRPDGREGGLVAPAAPTAPAAPIAPAAPAAPATPATPAAPAFLPPDMADAFALMLAQEQGEPMPIPREPLPQQPHQHVGPSELSDEIIDRIAARVADRLMQGLLGETVTRTVTAVSERLVREEIARIRASASAAPKNT